MTRPAPPRILGALPLLFLFFPAALSAQAEERLVAGELILGSLGAEGSAGYLFEATQAGVLTVAVRSLSGADLVLVVTDHTGQPLPNGRSDQDLGGDSGAEQFAATLPRAGEYRVRVESFSGEYGDFKVGVSWLPFAELEVAPDPDGTPDAALALGLAQGAHMDSIDGPAGDFWDWYVFRAESDGTLTVVTRAEEGDLVLEAFEEGMYTDPIARSDQDLQGSSGNEAVTVSVSAGDEFFFKVSAWSEGARIPYEIQAGLIEG